MALASLISAAEGPLALDFTADINDQFAPLVRAALANGAIRQPLLEACVAFGWDPVHAQFLHGRPDLKALAGKIKHVLLERLETIGQGSYSIVYKARDRISGDVVTLKVMRLFENEEESGVPAHTLREVSLLRDLRHPNIVRLRDVLWENTRLYLVMEYLDTDLLQFSRGGPLELPVVKKLMWQLVKGVCYSHARRVLHRDLKPANLLIDRATLGLKIADFGLARVFTPPVRPYTHEVVTQFYRAPEILLGAESYGAPVDMWSIGCIFAELILGTPMFQGDSEIGQLYKIFKVLGTPGPSVWPAVVDFPDWQPGFPQWQPQDLAQVLPRLAQGDAEGLNLLSRLFSYNPDQRITARAALRHPYFAEFQGQQRPAPARGAAAAPASISAPDGGGGGGGQDGAAAEPPAGPPAAAPAQSQGRDAPKRAAAKPPLPPSKRQCVARGGLAPSQCLVHVQ